MLNKWECFTWNKTNKVYIAVLSGGVTSSYVAYNMVKKYGKEKCRLFFIDTFSRSEDAAKYR